MTFGPPSRHFVFVQQHSPGAGNLWRARCLCGWTALARGKNAAEDARDDHLDQVNEEAYWQNLGRTGEH